MNVKMKAVIAVVVSVAVLGAAGFALLHRSSAGVTVILRISVTPSDQVDVVTGRANSAQFKYLVGKQSGLKPALAQKLTSTSVPHSPLVESRLGGVTADEARRYIEAFVPTLQDLCGQQVQLTLASQSLH